MPPVCVGVNFAKYKRAQAGGVTLRFLNEIPKKSLLTLEIWQKQYQIFQSFHFWVKLA